MSGPTVSVVIPVRDRRDLLLRTLSCLEAQTYPSEQIEVVVVDNHSTDGSGAAAREFAKAASVRVVVLEQPEGGAVAARNTGAAAATGEVLAFTDSDCRPAPVWIEQGLGALERADIVQGVTRADPDVHRGPLHRTVEGGFATGLYDSCNLFVRAEVFAKLGGFDEGFAERLRLPRTRAQLDYGFGEDTDLAWRAIRAGHPAADAPDALVLHHVFEPSARDSIRRHWVIGGFPSLVRSVPELRSTLLRSRLFIGETRPWFYLGLAGTLVSKRNKAFALAALPYLVQRFRTAYGSRTERLVALPALVCLDILVTVALAVGTAMSRTPVL